MYNVIIITALGMHKEKSTMKRVLPFIISIIFILSLSLSGCSEVDRSGELREFLSANEDAFSEVFTEESCEFSAFTEYMNNWAAANSIDVAFEGDHSMVLKNSAVKGYEDEPDCVLLCSFDTEKPDSNEELIATGQTALLGPVDHGDISLVITERAGGQFLGIDEVPADFIKCDNLINLNTGNNNTILTSGPVAATCSFHNSSKSTVSTYAQAFEIKMSMPEYTDPFDFVKGNSYPNPINTIGSFLASGKSSGKLFDIASFTSKSNEGYTPYFASAVVVVDSNHIESFKSRFDKSYENMADKFEKLEAEFEYTMEETEMPDKVLSEDVSGNLVSLMYTLNTGVCQQDEDSGVIYAASYIDSVNASKDNLDLVVNIRARGESYLDSLSMEYETTAGLCSTSYECKKAGRLWNSDAKSSLVTFFTSAVPLQGQIESATSLRQYENDIIAGDMPEQNMIIYTFEKGDRKTVLENIINFLDPSIQK